MRQPGGLRLVPGQTGLDVQVLGAATAEVADARVGGGGDGEEEGEEAGNVGGDGEGGVLGAVLVHCIG